MKKCLPAVPVMLFFATTALAERPPQKRENAKLAVTAMVKKITTETAPFGGDGVRTDYTAELTVNAVEKGDAVKAGDTITVTWFKVTKNPTKLLAGAYGHAYDLREKDRATFWLMDRGPNVPPGVWVIIYNKNGVEKLAK